MNDIKSLPEYLPGQTFHLSKLTDAKPLQPTVLRNIRSGSFGAELREVFTRFPQAPLTSRLLSVCFPRATISHLCFYFHIAVRIRIGNCSFPNCLIYLQVYKYRFCLSRNFTDNFVFLCQLKVLMCQPDIQSTKNI